MRVLAPAAILLSSLLCAGSGVAYAGWDEGVAAFTSKNYQQAATEFRRAVRESPQDWEAHLYLGRSYLELGKLDRAEKSLETAAKRARRARPAERKRVWKQLGYTYEKQKRYTKARKAFQRAGEPAEAARIEPLANKELDRAR